MMRLLLIMLVALVANAGTTASYTHGITGQFKRAGRVNWKGFGYYSRTTRRWTPLKAPQLQGDTVTAGKIAPTSDGGAIVVGDFTAVNGRSAAGVAVFDPVRNDWFPAAEVGLYRAAGGSASSFNCRANNGTGIEYITRNLNNAVTPFSSSGAVFNGAGFAVTPESIRVPPAVDPLTGLTQVLAATNPVVQQQKAYHSVGNGRAIIKDPTMADVFYVFGNFDLVGLNMDAAHNRDASAAGFVQFTYSPTTRRITPSIIGTRGYTARRATDPSDTLHPRECGQTGGAQCTATTCERTNDNSVHNLQTPVQAGITRDASGTYFFIQEFGRDVFRWQAEATFWTNVVVNGPGGTNQNLAPFSGNTLYVNFRVANASPFPAANRSSAPDPSDFRWSISKDATTLYLWRNVFPNIPAFTANGNGISGWFSFPWDDGSAGSKSYFGGAKSLTARGDTFESVWTDANFPASQFRNVQMNLPNQPALSSTGPLASYAVSRTTQLSLVDERLAGSPTYEQNRYANVQFLKVKRVAGAGLAAVTVDGVNGVQWVNGPRSATPSLDNNGNPQFAYGTQFTTLRNIREMNNQVIWVWSSVSDNDIFHEPDLSQPPGHTDVSGSRRFRNAIMGGLMAYDGTSWTQPLGGSYGGAFNPIEFWETTVAGDDRVYVVDNGNTPVWNFAAQSGVVLYDSESNAWVDPFGPLRLISLTPNWYDADASSVWSEVGAPGSVSVTHKLESGEHIFAGSFSWVGDTAAGSIIQWSGTNVGGGFVPVGSANTGLYIQSIGNGTPKRWIENFTPSGDNRKVNQGSVLAITNIAQKLYAGGVFDRSSNEVTSTNYLQNVAYISDVSDTAAVWTDIDGGCDGAVTQLLIYGDHLYAAGSFSNCGGLESPKNGLARINHLVRSEDRWESVGNGVQGNVNALVLWGSELVIAGAFTSADNSGLGRIALWNGQRYRYLGEGCNDVCSPKRLTVGAGTVSTNGLGTRINVPINSLVASGSRLYALLGGAALGASGATASGELVYHDGAQWYRTSVGGITGPTSDALNGFLTTNGTDVLLANGDLTASPLNSGFFTAAGTGNLLSVSLAATDEVHTVNLYHGQQNVDGVIVHLSGASVSSISALLVVAIVFILF